MSYLVKKCLKEVKQYSIGEIESIFKGSVYEKNYKKACKLIKKENYFHAEGIHGVSHIRRVLILSSVTSALASISERENRLLCLASVYHDIGRENDGTDIHHGERSVVKLSALVDFDEIKKEFSEDDIKILNFLIIGHVISDKNALRLLFKSDIEDKELAKRLLYFFKDCDGLDRLRIDDLNVNYLRNETSFKLLDFTIKLNNDKDYFK